MRKNLVEHKRQRCIVFILDQSTSMEEPFLDGPDSKADALASAINHLIHSLVIRYERDARLHDAVHLALIGYGDTVEPLLSGPLENGGVVPIATVARSRPIRPLPDRIASARNEAVPTWIEPVAKGATPMSGAIELARSLLMIWAREHVDSLAPVVINVSDGAATDGDPRPIAAQLQRVATHAGPTRFFNTSLSSARAGPIRYPSGVACLPDGNARTLFEMSSELTLGMVARCRRMNEFPRPGARGCVINADAQALTGFLDVTTSVEAAPDP